MTDKYYLVDYWDLLDNHLLYRTNSLVLALDKIFSFGVRSWRAYVGHLEYGSFVPERLFSRSAPYYEDIYELFDSSAN